jgi:hypothetical protein
LNVDWENSLLVDIKREEKGIDLLVINVVYEEEGAVVLGLAAARDAA